MHGFGGLRFRDSVLGGLIDDSCSTNIFVSEIVVMGFEIDIHSFFIRTNKFRPRLGVLNISPI